MAQPDWTELTHFAIALAKASASEILPFFRRNTAIDVKQAIAWDPVTEGDRAGERIIRQMIEDRYPDHGIAVQMGAGPRGWYAVLCLRHADLGHPHRPEL